MRVFERLVSVVRGGGDEVRLTIKREDDGHVILLTPVLRNIDADEKDDVIRTLHGLLSVPTRIKVPKGQDADEIIEQYLAGTAHAERASAVVALGEYNDAIREAANAAKTATSAKVKAAAKPAKSPPPSETVATQKAAAEIDDEEPAEAAEPVAPTDPSASDMSVASLFGEHA